MTLQWAQARQRAYAAPAPLPARSVRRSEAAGTTLAEPLVAAAAVPPFTNSAMDGYAVAGSGPWRLVTAARLAPGEAAAIATGRPVPEGTDAVLPVEHAEQAGDRLTGEVRSGRHIRQAGEAFAAGAVLAPPGTPVGPVLLGLAASAAVDSLAVHGPVCVRCVLTGDELIDHGVPAGGRVRDAVGPMLAALVPALGARLEATARIGDDRAAWVRELSAPARVIVTCGATSVGPRDLLRPVLRELGADLVVDGVDCRPGHPQLLARLPGDRWLVGLPGNPFAALAAALTLLEPLVLALLARPLPQLGRARLAVGCPPSGCTRLVPVTSQDGALVPAGHDAPGSLWGAALASALAVVPAGWNGRDPVPFLPLPR